MDIQSAQQELRVIEHYAPEEVYRSLEDLVAAAVKARGVAFTNLSKKEPHNVREGIKASCRVAPSFASDGVVYRMLHNSEFKGYRYLKENQTITVPDACVSSSLDRLAPGLTCARVMELDGQSIAYAGRPDTQAKFRELVAMIFLDQLEKRLIQQNEDDSYNLHFVINSFISTFSYKDLHLPGEMSEYKLLQAELEMLETAPKEMVIDGRMVHLDWKIFCGNFNFMNNPEKALPPAISGKLRGQTISSSIADLENMLPEQRSPLLTNALVRLTQGNLAAEEELFLRLLICKEAGIPTVLHCRSCIDRTSIAAAMLYAMHQFNIDVNNPLSALDDPEFKRLFWEHIKIAHEVSSYSREEYGFKWRTDQSNFLQNPGLLRLLPNHVKTTFNFFELSSKEQFRLWSPIKFKNWKPKLNLYAPMAPIFTIMSGLSLITSFCYHPEISKLPAVLATLAAGALSLMIMKTLFDLGLIFGTYIFLVNTIQRKTAHWTDPARLAAGAALALFTMIPEKIIKPGTEGIEGKPLMFGDKVAQSAETV